MSGIVYLVGAGPGDPSLITQRALEVLARADVVAYDRLVNPSLLGHATGARLVDVGKQPGADTNTQQRINDVLVEEARAGRVVVRLKGGDPFVFGRGGEEADALLDAGVAFEVVPGVTSAIAGPAYAGIPLTDRRHASWAAIATGHEDPAKPESGLDWAALAAAPTAVFLMGVGRLEAIAERLREAGKPGETPAAVVASATLPGQRVISSRLADIAAAVASEGITPPALLVVGPVVSMSERLDWFARRPLAGRRVFITRTRSQAGHLASELRELGAEPLEFPTIRVEPSDDLDRLDDELSRLRELDWTVFTSANAVAAVFDRLERRGRDARAFGSVRVAAVGPATTAALRRRGIIADLVPSDYTAHALIEALGRPDGAERAVLLPQADQAGLRTQEALEAAGWQSRAVIAYRTVADTLSIEAGRRALDEGVDAIAFTSGSTVRSFAAQWGKPPAGCAVVCIGPQTARAASAAGLAVDVVATEHTIDGLVAGIVTAVGG